MQAEARRDTRRGDQSRHTTTRERERGEIGHVRARGELQKKDSQNELEHGRLRRLTDDGARRVGQSGSMCEHGAAR